MLCISVLQKDPAADVTSTAVRNTRAESRAQLMLHVHILDLGTDQIVASSAVFYRLPNPLSVLNKERF